MARRGGRIAGNARRELEQETGRPVVTAENAQTLQQLVTGAVEDAVALAEGDGGDRERQGVILWTAETGRSCSPSHFAAGAGLFPGERGVLLDPAAAIPVDHEWKRSRQK